MVRQRTFQVRLQEFGEMNRQQRRAAQKQQTPGAGEAGTPVNRLADLNSLRIDIPEHLTLPAGSLIGDFAAPAAAKPSLMVRVLAKILLSPWVLARVQHPDVDRLLMNFAIQTNRIDVADELTRRQAMRSSALF